MSIAYDALARRDNLNRVHHNIVYEIVGISAIYQGELIIEASNKMSKEVMIRIVLGELV